MLCVFRYKSFKKKKNVTVDLYPKIWPKSSSQKMIKRDINYNNNCYTRPSAI